MGDTRFSHASSRQLKSFALTIIIALSAPSPPQELFQDFTMGMDISWAARPDEPVDTPCWVQIPQKDNWLLHALHWVWIRCHPLHTGGSLCTWTPMCWDVYFLVLHRLLWTYSRSYSPTLWGVVHMSLESEPYNRLTHPRQTNVACLHDISLSYLYTT